MLVRWTSHRPTVYKSDGIRAGSKGLENTCMVNTCNQYQNNGQALLSSLHRSREPSMVWNHHEEDDREDPEVILARLEKNIATLIDLVT
jgi:hypothetical protein